ncbi:PepSY-associated TM helix domain-containing protein [Ferruginibacter sp.]
MKNKRLLSLHSILGLFIGIFILALSVSGALLVFHEEIDALQRPVIGPTKTPKAMLTVDSCYRIVQTAYPHASISSCSMAKNDREAFAFTIYDSSYKNGDKGLQVFLHPTTGNILQTRGGSEDMRHNFMSWLAAFHSSFHAGKTGEWLLGFFAVIFVLSLVTGIILYRKNIVATILFKKTVWKKNNLHQLIGTWALLFNLMIGVTGFWMQRYVFKKDFYKSYDWVNTIKASPNLFYNFDSAYNQIEKKYPAFTGYVIYFTQSKKGKTAIYGSNSTNAFIHSKKFADVVFLDSTGATAKTRFINEISADDRYDIINSQLHMARYGGAPIKIIYSCFGISSAILSITGFLLWRRRKRNSR